MSDTPRTDALCTYIYNSACADSAGMGTEIPCEQAYGLMVDLAKQLERELIAADKNFNGLVEINNGNIDRIEQLQKELAAAQRCPEGWVCVPKAPTEEMLHAVEFWRDTDRCRNEAVRYYIAMLKAAPTTKEAQDD